MQIGCTHASVKSTKTTQKVGCSRGEAEIIDSSYYDNYVCYSGWI